MMCTGIWQRERERKGLEIWIVVGGCFDGDDFVNDMVIPSNPVHLHLQLYLEHLFLHISAKCKDPDDTKCWWVPCLAPEPLSLTQFNDGHRCCLLVVHSWQTASKVHLGGGDRFLRAVSTSCSHPILQFHSTSPTLSPNEFLPSGNHHYLYLIRPSI